MITGGCFCGRIRYEAEGSPYHDTVCHCSICRRVTGAPLVGWVSVSARGFRFTEGQPNRFRSSRHATRTFCPNCGTALTFQLDETHGEIDLTIGSLDKPDAVEPQDQIWVQSRFPWTTRLDRLPEHPKGRGNS